MSIADEIRKHVGDTFSSAWSVRNGTVVPEPKDLNLSNDAVYFEKATVLYADLDGSTDLVEKMKWEFSGQIYKTFLYAASRLIRQHGGSIVSYDGDRVMGVFISNRQRNEAVSCALEIHYAVSKIVQDEIKRGWKADFKIKHVIGIDTSPIRAARTGVRGDNDLVWIGNAANLAAKLTALNADTPIWITKAVYDVLDDAQKLDADKMDIWKSWLWNEHDNREIFSTTYWRAIS
ncbi:MAG: adenylate/guanylate cyclase domain-containing protein [Croceibacterium sp.]